MGTGDTSGESLDLLCRRFTCTLEPLFSGVDMFVSVVNDKAGAEADMMEVSCCRFSECVDNPEKSNKAQVLVKFNLHTSKTDVWVLEIKGSKDKGETR